MFRFIIMVVYNMNYNILEVKEMPFTMKGYPEKWKEFEVIKRQKAIEIANAMLNSEYATTDNEEHIQEQSNQDKSYFDSESIGNQSGGVRQREPLMDGPHPKVVESFKDV